MTSDRWERIKELFHTSLELQPEQRNSFLAEACAGDLALREEVESLLKATTEGFMERGCRIGGSSHGPRPGGVFSGIG